MHHRIRDFDKNTPDRLTAAHPGAGLAWLGQELPTHLPVLRSKAEKTGGRTTWPVSWARRCICRQRFWLRHHGNLGQTASGLRGAWGRSRPCRFPAGPSTVRRQLEICPWSPAEEKFLSRRPVRSARPSERGSREELKTRGAMYALSLLLALAGGHDSSASTRPGTVADPVARACRSTS